MSENYIVINIYLQKGNMNMDLKGPSIPRILNHNFCHNNLEIIVVLWPQTTFLEVVQYN